MHLLKLDLKLSRLSLIIWTAALSSVMAICVLIYPIMEQSMAQLGEMFADMQVDMESIYGNFMKYFASEFSAEFGLGATLFAAITGIRMLSKEESSRTAEFLLTHPISRKRVVTEKLLSLVISLTVLNVVVLLVVLGCCFAIGATFEFGTMLQLFLLYFMLQLQIGAMTFGLSSLLRRGGIGIGLGMSVGLYFLDIIASLTEETEFLKYFTPFGYANGTALVNGESIEFTKLFIGILLTAGGFLLAYLRYPKKDIH